MTDNVNPNIGQDDDEGLFDPAKDMFPSKEDLEDRLVVIYPTGKTGERVSQSTGKPYTWYETTTVVLDDGPDGWRPTVTVDHVERENLVPSVADNGPQVLRNFQWSTGALTARLAPIADDAKVRSIVGRINTRPPTKKGMNPPWGIAKPTEDEMNVARQYADVCRQARLEIREHRQKASDEAAF